MSNFVFTGTDMHVSLAQEKGQETTAGLWEESKIERRVGLINVCIPFKVHISSLFYWHFWQNTKCLITRVKNSCMYSLHRDKKGLYFSRS